jgi:ubiquinone biosynthesis protein COQ4
MGYENLKPALQRIQMVSGFIAGRGQRTETVFEIEDSYRKTPQMQACLARMKADPEMARRIAEGYTTPDFDLDELAKYPPGSLARTYARLMQLQSYKPHFYPDLPLDDEENYIIMRMRKTHDLHHVVTGFGMNGPGEVGVIAVGAYQFGYPAYVLIDLAAMALTFQQGEGFQNAIDDVGRGLMMGHSCKP